MEKKTVTLSLNYSFEVVAQVEVPADWTEEEMKNTFREFPISVTIDEVEDEVCHPDVVINGTLLLTTVTQEDSGYFELDGTLVELASL